MKKKWLAAVVMATVMLAGCGKTGNADDAVVEMSYDELTDLEGADEAADEDYTDEVKKAVKEAAQAGSLQEELAKIEEAEASFTEQLQDAQTQSGMTKLSQWPYQVWEMELNSLVRRVMENMEAVEAVSLKKEQNVWPSIRDKMAEEAVKDFKDGSIYEQLLSGEMTAITRTRAYEIAADLAQIKGESFEYPERNECGKYIHLEGTDKIKDYLIVTESIESGYVGVISVEGVGGLEGIVEKNGDDLVFTTYDETVKAKINADWDGATFEVMEAKDEPFTEGSVYEFPVVIQ